MKLINPTMTMNDNEFISNLHISIYNIQFKCANCGTDVAKELSSYGPHDTLCHSNW